MTRLFVYVLVALGLNLLTGYAGQVSLGHAAFFAIGAYTAAVLAERWQWPSLLCLLAAAVFTGLIGYLLGLPCLRLSGLYLAMATLGFTLIVQEMLLQLAVLTHGSEGMKVVPASLLGFTFDSDTRKYYILLVVTAGMLLFARNLVRGRTGPGVPGHPRQRARGRGHGREPGPVQDDRLRRQRPLHRPGRGAQRVHRRLPRSPGVQLLPLHPVHHHHHPGRTRLAARLGAGRRAS